MQLPLGRRSAVTIVFRHHQPMEHWAGSPPRPAPLKNVKSSYQNADALQLRNKQPLNADALRNKNIRAVRPRTNINKIQTFPAGFCHQCHLSPSQSTTSITLTWLGSSSTSLLAVFAKNRHHPSVSHREPQPHRTEPVPVPE